MATENPKRIFIVEDNELYSMMLDYILSKDSIYQFVSFKSGEECLQNLYLNPDVIILDYGLPGINGYQTLVEIKKQKPEIHVVMLTNNADIKLAGKMLDAGADDYVLKQGHGELEIISKIEDALKKDLKKTRSPFGIKNKSFAEKIVYLIVVVALLSLGIFCLNK